MTQYNDCIGVVTVCFNNPKDLHKTLTSLSECCILPSSVIVVDGSINSEVRRVTGSFENLRIELIQEPDDGPYDAMNKGKKYLDTPLVHYLNSGDEVIGNPYSGLISPSLLPVNLIDPKNKDIVIKDKLKLRRTQYCHQGIIFPTTHQIYDLNLRICADYDCMIQTFGSLDHLPIHNQGSVNFYLDGISSKMYFRKVCEIIKVHTKYFGLARTFLIIFERIRTKIKK